MSEDLVNLAQRWPERHATHYDGCEADHVGCLVKKLAREVERLTSERNAAQAEGERLKTERDQTETRPRGREVGRFGWDGHYIDYRAMEPTRPSDEDIWREAFITMLPSFPWEKAAEKSDCVLVEYRKRWPR